MIPTKFKKRKESFNLVTGSIVAILIAVSPYIFYLYESFPREETWKTWFFYFSSKRDLFTTAWLIFSKLVPLYLITIWFLTCKHWWYHAILIPISMYVFQLMSLFNEDIRFIDEFEIYYIIPIMMIVIPLVYLIRLKIFDKVVHGIDLKQIDKELEKYDALDRELERESRFYQS
ncbi:hypothetical protein [Robertkochia flava]|uniref:hypothetical protein n=1 Tax=Robertkochia flava TaxID=3447986 RepID=UPI001CCE37C8|nr:hypothetical protein [Robertkochia marina]